MSRVGEDGRERHRAATAGDHGRAGMRLAGVPVRADATLLVVGALVAWSFWMRFGRVRSSGTAVLMALVASALFFGSILAHELAHALTARRRGLRVQDITLYVFGGATRIAGEFARPADEAVLGAAGPWTSIVLGCAFGLVAHAAGDSVAGEVAGELGWLNLLLGAFNLLPGAPLDGGRVLDAAVWRLTGDRSRAGRVAAAAGQVLGAVVAALGLSEMLLVGGGFVAGLWLVVIGWFLVGAATGEGRAARLRAQLRGRRAGDLAAPVAVVPLGVPVEDAVAWCRRFGRADVALVAGLSGRAVGVLDLAVVERLAPPDRRVVPVDQVMVPVGSVPSVDAGAPAAELLDVVGSGPVVVVADGAAQTVVTADSLLRALRWIGPAPVPGEPNGVPGGGPSLAGRGGAGGAPACGGAVDTRRAPSPIGMARGRARRWTAMALAAGTAAVVAAAAVTVPMPVVDLGPGPALDLPSMITSAGPVHDVTGQLLLTSVSVGEVSAAGMVGALFMHDHDLSLRTDVVPSGIGPQEWGALQVQVFHDSVQLAAALALRAAGYRVTIAGGGALVLAVTAGGPSDGLLQPGDAVTAVDGRPVVDAADLLAELAAVDVGSPVTLQVRRRDAQLAVTVHPGGGGAAGRPVLGIAVEDAAPAVDLPFEVGVGRTDIGGPSAGLMTAIAVYAMTTGADLTGGRTIAGTGTIDALGTVGAVGGVAQKVAAAAAAGARLFLVPAAEAAEARNAAGGHRGMRVVGVSTFAGALQELRTATG